MEKWRKNLYFTWVTQIISLLGFGFGFPFIPFYLQDLGVTDPAKLKLWTGVLTSAPGLAMAVMAPIWGTLADKYGKKPMLLRALFSGAVVMVCMGLAPNAVFLLVVRLVQGALTGTVSASSALVASGTPDKKLSYALGFLASSTFIGYSLGPAIGGIIAESFGFRTSFFVGAVILLIGFVLDIIFIEEPGAAAVPAETKVSEGKEEARKNSSAAMLLTPGLLVLFLQIFLIRLCRTLPAPFLPLLIQETRSTAEGAARLTGLLSGGVGLMTALSGIFLTRLGDRMNKATLLLGLLFAGACFAFPAFFSKGLVLFSVFYMLTYFMIGGVEPLVQSLTSERIPAEHRGKLFGLQTMVGSVGWIISPLVGSWVSISFSLRAVYLVFSVFILGAFFIAYLSRRRIDPRKAGNAVQ